MDRKMDRNRSLADYIYNDLSPEQTVEMEMEIAVDPELRESYELHRQVKEYLQTKLQLEEMRSDPRLEDVEKLADLAFASESREPSERMLEPAGKKIRFRRITAAAAIAATVALLFTFGILPPGVDQDRLFDRYYAPLEASDFTQRGESGEMFREVALGINHYLDGNYQQSIDQLDGLASDPALESEVSFFSALSCLGLGQYEQAQSLLAPLVDSQIRYQAESLWYLSLCCLKTGEYEKTGSLLGQLERYDGMYKQDAQGLRKKLRRFK
ncbi:MAG: hypothetical protein P1P86_07885 [Bacteroidales bacterium]|nr:hypothetical protein [Bacteroidales bacterium]